MGCRVRNPGLIGLDIPADRGTLCPVFGARHDSGGWAIVELAATTASLVEEHNAGKRSNDPPSGDGKP
jgi:hypothetical protein